MTAGFDRRSFLRALDRLPVESQAALLIRAQSFAAGLKADFTEWNPGTDLAQLVDELADLLDAVGDIVDELDIVGNVTTTREDAIRLDAEQSGADRGAGDQKEIDDEEWRNAIVNYFEVAGERAERMAEPIVIRDRWDALTVADAVRAQVSL